MKRPDQGKPRLELGDPVGELDEFEVFFFFLEF